MKDRIFMTDVNGTLTVARQPIEGDMAKVLERLVEGYKLVVITGGPWEDVKEQMPASLVTSPNVDFWCNHGNVLYREGKEISNTGSKIDYEMLQPLLEDIVNTCPMQFEKSYPVHYELYGDSAVNFTMLGRPEGGEPSKEDREAYEAWDAEVGQREYIVDFISKILPEYDVSIGGQISIDIVKKGSDKSQIVDNYADDYRITFFGDRIMKHGNDNLIGHKLADIGATIYNVHNPAETVMFMNTVLDIAEMEKND